MFVANIQKFHSTVAAENQVILSVIAGKAPYRRILPEASAKEKGLEVGSTYVIDYTTSETLTSEGNQVHWFTPIMKLGFRDLKDAVSEFGAPVILAAPEKGTKAPSVVEEPAITEAEVGEETVNLKARSKK
jgi:hypothetical protein